MRKTRNFQDYVSNKILFSLGVILLIRVGTFLPVPGINHSDLAFYIQQHSVAKTLISTFSGENTFVIGLFTLNIFPYINATIFVQLLTAFSPRLAELQKEGDFEGRRTMNKLTRSITLGLAIVQSSSIALYLKQVLFNWDYILAFEIIMWLTTGAMIVLWLSDLITDYGLGNGASLLVYTNIVSNLPTLLKKLSIETSNNVMITSFSLIVSGVLIFISLYAIVFLQEGIVKVPLISSKQLNQSITRVDNFLPLRLNQAGVMPIILTTSILVIPNYIINLKIFQGLDFLTSFNFKPIYWIGYFLLVLLSSSFYAKIVVRPKDLSNQLQKMAVTIPGIRPGKQTTRYLKRIIKEVTITGATMLAIITVIPNFLESILNITGLKGLSTTSFLILAGVVLDLLREIKNISLSNIYKRPPKRKYRRRRRD